MAKIRVVTDSAGDIPVDLAKRLNIDVIPLTIRFGDEEFVDLVDLTPKAFWAKCKESPTLPETAAPSPGAFQEAYERALADGCDGVIVITLSSELSATNQAAVIGGEAMNGRIPVEVIDTKAVTMAEGLVTIEVAEAAATGATLDQLSEIARNASAKTHVVGTISTLEHLVKGGRITGAKALLGSVLAIKPLLQLRDGIVVEAGRQRTRARALAACVEEAVRAQPLRRIALVHGDADDIEATVASLRTVTSEFPLIVGDIGSVVGTHGGPGIVGVCWISA
jgi:DegV family protein with EDD domain